VVFDFFSLRQLESVLLTYCRRQSVRAKNIFGEHTLAFMLVSNY
jgi:hypothetical protein